MENKNGASFFGVTTATGFFEIVKANHEQFLEDTADPRTAINCILTLYHLHEWVWSRWLKGNFCAQKELKIRNKKGKFTAWLDRNCPHFSLLQKLVNGTKHCNLLRIDDKLKFYIRTDKIAGWGQGAWGQGGWSSSYLSIDLGEDYPPKERYFVASAVLKKVFEFWQKFFDDYRISAAESNETATPDTPGLEPDPA